LPLEIDSIPTRGRERKCERSTRITQDHRPLHKEAKGKWRRRNEPLFDESLSMQDRMAFLAKIYAKWLLEYLIWS